MDTIAKRSDRALYELSFMNTPRLGKSIGIEKCVERWRPEIVGEVEDKSSRVEKKADLFLEMSKLLNLGMGNSMSEIMDVLNGLPIKEPWFIDKSKVVEEKLQELEMVIIHKISGMSLDEMVKCDKFVEETNWFDRAKVEEAEYQALNGVVTLENLDSVLLKFAKFSGRLQVKYKMQVESMLKTLEKLMNSIDDKGAKLDLYTLDVDDTYLDKIRYITNGLVFEKYQKISIGIDNVIETLRFLETIDKDLHTELQSEIKTIITQFKQHATQQDNKPLIKYLTSLLT